MKKLNNGHIAWTTTEDTVLKNNYPDMLMHELIKLLPGRSIASIYGRANIIGVKRSQTFLRSNASGRLTSGTVAGYNTRFKKGQVAFNKGKKMTDYMSPKAIANSSKTRFTKGQISHNTVPVGTVTLRTSRSGNFKKQYYFIKTETGILHYHVHLWRQQYGAIPHGHIVVFKDKNQLNCVVENLECITRQENMARNKIVRYPTEIITTLKLIKKINKKTSQHEKQNN